MEIISSLLFIFASLLFALVSFEHKSLFFFRWVGVIVSAFVIFMFNENWIFGASINLSFFSFLLLIAVLLIKQKQKINLKERFGEILKIKWRRLLVNVSVLLILFLSAFFYFKGNLNEPRYITADAGTHFLYMNGTAKTGILPMFRPSEIYPASGNNEVFKDHHKMYFPGPAAGFYLLSKVSNFINPVVLFQLFNALFYVLVAGYLYFLFSDKLKLGFKVLLLLTLAFGPLFNLVTNSFTSQMFGLFLLVFFVDVFWKFYFQKGIIILPVLALAAVVLSYFYWLPVALIFALVMMLKDIRKYNHELLIKYSKIFGIFVAALLLASGFIISTLEVNTISHAGDDGGFPFYKEFIKEWIVVIPIAILNLFLLLRDRKQEKTSLLGLFSVAAISYTLLLAVGYAFKIVSNYTFMKSFFLSVPLVWILGWDFLNSHFNLSAIKKWSLINFQTKTVVAYWLITTLLISFMLSKQAEIFPLEQNNLALAAGGSRSANITTAQLGLLKFIKEQQSDKLSDGRILVIAPYDTALWVFAYSGIWPRTMSLIGEGESANGAYSPMSIFSPNIANYYRWLKNDKDHYLVMFDKSDSKQWVEEVGFNERNYQDLASVGDNHFLKLKNGEGVDMLFQDIDPNSDQLKGERVPYENEIIAKYDNLSGIAFRFMINKKELKSEFKFSLKEGDCKQNGKLILQQEISKEKLNQLKRKEFFSIKFDSISGSAEKTYCYKIDGEAGGLEIPEEKESGKVLLQDMYKFKIN